MEITDVNIKLVEQHDGSNNNLRAYCSIVFDGMFVVHDLKIIEIYGRNIVSMPVRKLCDHCSECGTKNILRARWCNGCGTRLAGCRADRNADGSYHLYVDVAHPTTPEFRAVANAAVLAKYRLSLP